MAEEATQVEGQEEVKKKRQKLSKNITDDGIVQLGVLSGEKGVQDFSFDGLPDDIKGKLGPFGLGHKLGDAAAGKDGKDAEDSIQKVYDGLKAGDWSVRAPAAPKVTVSVIVENFASLALAERKRAYPLVSKLGLSAEDMARIDELLKG